MAHSICVGCLSDASNGSVSHCVLFCPGSCCLEFDFGDVTEEFISPDALLSAHDVFSSPAPSMGATSPEGLFPGMLAGSKIPCGITVSAEFWAIVGVSRTVALALSCRA